MIGKSPDHSKSKMVIKKVADHSNLKTAIIFKKNYGLIKELYIAKIMIKNDAAIF